MPAPEQEPQADYSHPKRLRIRRSADYRRIQGRGRRLREPRLLALVLPGPTAECRVGITVSRKVGNAVVRNRVKRWLREAIRHERGRLSRHGKSWDVVLIAHPVSATADAHQLRADVASVFDRIATNAPPRPQRDRRDRRRRGRR